jgi:hypothetical protein
MYDTIHLLDPRSEHEARAATLHRTASHRRAIQEARGGRRHRLAGVLRRTADALAGRTR